MKIATMRRMSAKPKSPDTAENPAKRLKKLSAPANDEELLDYHQACAAAEMEPADTLRKLARAFVLHVREHRSVMQPLRLARPDKAK